MIVEIPNLNLKTIKKDSILIFDGRTFQAIPKEKFFEEYANKHLEYESYLNEIDKRIAYIEKLNLESQIELLHKLDRYTAFLRLVNDIEEGLIEIPEDYAEIKSWIESPVGEMPKGLENYMN